MLLHILLSKCASLAKFEGTKEDLPLTYYSMVKPSHVESMLFLSSMEYSYSGGSHQQMTRGTKFCNFAETFWTIYPGLNLTHLHQGDSVKCGDRVRFLHATTRVWLQARRVVLR
jgi:hypothetical protein